MAQEFNAPGVTPKKSNTTLIIVIVIVAVLLCCCCLGIALAYFYGDAVLEMMENGRQFIPGIFSA